MLHVTARLLAAARELSWQLGRFIKKLHRHPVGLRGYGQGKEGRGEMHTPSSVFSAGLRSLRHILPELPHTTSLYCWKTI